MHSETPHILQKKPGEPGGEKAEMARNTAHGIVADWLANDDGTPAEQRDRLVAAIEHVILGALAARALEEAREWAGETLNMPLWQRREWAKERLAALERAAEGKALGKPEVRAT